MPVTLVHLAKAVGRNEMPFGTVTGVVPSNIVLDRGPVPHGKGRFGGQNPICGLRNVRPQTLYNVDAHLYTTLNHYSRPVKVV